MTRPAIHNFGRVVAMFALIFRAAAPVNGADMPVAPVLAASTVQPDTAHSSSINTRGHDAYASIGPYSGTVVKGVDATTMDGKVMCGYQGWFGAPGDGSPGQGWRHWTKHRGPLEDGNAKIDLWPDVSELSSAERFSTGFKFADGRTAEVFSSYEKPTVLRHFEWMQDYGIDGVFVQRFAVELRNQKNLERVNTVLANCRAGANEHGRTY